MNAPAATGSPLSPARAVFLIARREFLSRVRSRVFAIGTAIVVALLVLYVAAQALVINRISTSPTSNVGFTTQTRVLAGPFVASAAVLGSRVHVSVVDEAQGESEVRSGGLDALVTGAPDAPQVVVASQLGGTLRIALVGVVRQQVLADQLSAAGLDPAEVEARAASATVHVRSLQPRAPADFQQPLVGFVTAWVLYIALQLYGNFIAQGVVEDKSSRIVEILLSTVRPGQLLMGKVLGIGLVGMLQLAIVGTAGLVLTVRANIVTVPNLAAGAVAAALLWFAIGFVLYGVAYAAAGSLVSRQEDLATATLPVGLLLIASVLLSYAIVIPEFASRSGLPAGTVVLSLLPPFAPVLMPLRMDSGDLPAWQMLLAVVLALAAVAALTAVAGRVYANSVLRIGARVSLRDALRRRS